MDSITKCVAYQRATGGVNHYEVTFSFDGVDVPAQYCVITLLDSDLQDPDNLEEVKTAACTRAKFVKALYSTGVSTPELIGPVEL